MAKQQRNVCAICGKPETAERNGKPRRLAVDHCHDTGKVRGLLCGSYSPMIGYADHSIDILTRAIKYLRRAKEGVRGQGMAEGHEQPLLPFTPDDGTTSH